MKQKRFAIPSRFLLVLFLVLAGTHIAGRAAASLPAQLTDEQFWKLSTELSESDGNFRSDNLLSNELWFQYIIPELTGAAKAGRVYMGVGPEQNFTYIAALKPKMAFIVDIRRGNLDLHLMYKALFELSKDRAEFVGLLFSRPRPESLSATSSVKDIFDAYAKVEANEEAFKKNLTNIVGHLAKKHGFGLSDDDVRGVEYVYRNFFRYGPSITYSSSGSGFGGGSFVPYYSLMIADDGAGVLRSYLANEENFGFIKDLETRNMIVPVIGDFAGPKAIRAVGKYLKENDGMVSAFYLSNVEQYLSGVWNNFCANVATLPLDDSSTFIRSVRGNGGLNSQLGHMLPEVQGCVAR
jgi:hypothetical protein